MGREPLILAIDQGTTGTTVLLVNRESRVVGRGYAEVRQIYPQPGWVEHDPLQIWENVLEAIDLAKADARCEARQIFAIGVTNQRETTVLWDAETGRPVANAIVWQCRRTASLCDALREQGWEEPIRQKTGLPVDAYFSGTKVRWLLDNHPSARELAAAGRLRFGTVDSWLLWQLSGGALHVTDPSNASRTMLFNLHTVDWDDDLLRLLEVPRTVLPRIVDSSGVCGTTAASPALPAGIPLAGIAGDQQAALFGQACFEPGQLKATYGTGGFLLLNCGERPLASQHGLVSTVAWSRAGQPTYALEGSIFIAGAVVQWLRDELRLVRTAAETEELALSLKDNGGVYLVPAFVGLGAPYWDMHARGTVVGLTRGTGRAHLARAALESIAYQVRDVVEAMEEDWGQAIASLRVDGGATQNGFLLQFQSDLLGIPILKPAGVDRTGLGAAYLAGLAIGFWSHERELAGQWVAEREFRPGLTPDERNALHYHWRRAVERASSWI